MRIDIRTLRSVSLLMTYPMYGVPQGGVLSPILFLIYVKVQVRDFRAMLFGDFPVKVENFTRVYNPNRGLRVSSIKR